MDTNTQPRRPKGTPAGGQFATKVQPESTIAVGPESASIDGHEYEVSRSTGDSGADVWTFMGTEGGWRFWYDDDSKTAIVTALRPTHPSPEWLDRGEADIRKVVRSVYPGAGFVRIGGGHYYAIGGPSHAVAHEPR